MKKAIGLISLIFSFLAVSINAQGVAPNEVRVFRHPDFMGDSATYFLEDGMRHKLINFLGDLDNSISSILIGSDVAVMVFSEPACIPCFEKTRSSLASIHTLARKSEGH